ncbi:nuclear transport factor 2 family protein [Streptomyces sp. CoH27]|uniref:nuclear transport factor 2 family protein n=1 Tax=Streptomyces sp. CoH27 TaxID=2875763 RepID=UPI001CD25EE2|nr:nuclear transport factor 2 family protein [Streptomyces sp. CoH27]
MASAHGRRWSDAFADPSGGLFHEILAADVEFAGSVVMQPVYGRHTVWTCLRTASSIYEHVEFTTDTVAGDRVYLEWTAAALGMRMDGVTALVLDANGDFAKVTVYHQPLAAVFAFSAEMARRLAPGPGADHFYRA